MIFTCIVNDTHSQCNVTSSNDQKLYYRRLEKKGRVTPRHKRLQTRQTDHRLQREYSAPNATEYYGE